jgi:hypothetical protein
MLNLSLSVLSKSGSPLQPPVARAVPEEGARDAIDDILTSFVDCYPDTPSSERPIVIIHIRPV